MRNKRNIWSLYQTAKTFSRRPSELVGVKDDWVAYQLDNAIRIGGAIIDNALNERINVGGDKKPNWIDKYTLQQLLDPGFRLPIDEHESVDDFYDSMSVIRGIVAKEIK